MGAASVDLPTIGVGGPMLNGKRRGQELGSGTGVWSMRRAGARHAASAGLLRRRAACTAATATA